MLSWSDYPRQVARHCWTELRKGTSAPARQGRGRQAQGRERRHPGSGINIVLRALERRSAKIAESAGVEGSIVVGKITENKSADLRLRRRQTEQYVDMLSAGIVDPAKVVRVALQDAASVAGLMITTEASPRDQEYGRSCARPFRRVCAWPALRRTAPVDGSSLS